MMSPNVNVEGKLKLFLPHSPYSVDFGLDINVIVPILENLKLSTEVPEASAARAPPEIQRELW